jgi:PAS domain S-box-containing protein
MKTSPYTLLIIEDFPADRELYRQALLADTSTTYHLLEAESVAEGLELCQRQKIDAVLLNYLLPDANGLEFLQQLSAQNNSYNPAVVMIAGQGSESLAVRAIKAGAEDYLAKRDLTPELLQLTVRNAILQGRELFANGNTYLRPQVQQSQAQAELRLEAKNQQITTIWESMTDAYITLDRQWQMIYTNPTATEVVRQLVGLTPEEFLGKTHWEVFPWSVGNIVEQEYRRAVTDQVAVHFELFYEPTETWFEIHAYPSDVGLGIYFRDVNQRKLDELARIAAERERDRFFELSLDLLAIANLDNYFLRLNPAWEQTLGFTTAELMAKPFLDFVHPDDRATTLATAQGLSRGQMVVRFENRYLCKDGSYRWLSWSSRPYDEQNLVYAVAYDITVQKRDEELLRQSEELKRRIFESSRDCIKVVDLQGRLVYINDHGQSLMEIDDFDTVARSQWLEFWQDSTRELAQTAFSTAFAGEVFRFDGSCLTAKGTLKWWEVIVTPILAADGQVSQILSVSRDITERKRAERNLRESQERLQTGIEVAGLGLARFDYETNLVELSPEAALLYGFDPSQTFATREQIHATFHPDERAALEDTIAQVIDPDGAGWFAQDHRVVWPSGEVRCLSVRKQVFFDRDGAVPRPSYAILAAIDITKRQQNQADLEQRNRDLDSFVYIVSHDLKAPLRAVSNLSQWIEDDLEGSLTAANQEQMNLLRDRIQRMSTTIDGLLDYARVGRTDASNDLVVVAQLLAEIIESLAPPQTFKITIAPDLPTLYTKRLLLTQVFANLIGNGIKHHDRTDGEIHISIAERSDLYEFAIADNGPGIAPDQHDRVFEIFQAVNPQKRNDSTGIGLAIVKKIIEAEGGTIRLESEIDKGTTFYFTWPKRS